jgi:hypothetical protein
MATWLRRPKLPWGYSLCRTWSFLRWVIGEASQCLRCQCVNCNTFPHIWSACDHTQIHCKRRSWAEWTSSCHLADFHDTVWSSAACLHWRSWCWWSNQFSEEWLGTSWPSICASNKFPVSLEILNTFCAKCGWNCYIGYLWGISKSWTFSYFFIVTIWCAISKIF